MPRPTLLLMFLYLSFASPSRAQAVGDGLRIDLTERLSLDTGGGQFAQLFVPDYYEAHDDGKYTLIFHLHSASWAAENQVYRAHANAIVFNIHLGALSSPYQNYFSDSVKFQTILNLITSELDQREIVTEPLIDNLIVTSFSAGYAGLREILKTNAYYDQITAIHLADGLHATSNPSIMEEQMQYFVQYARDARDKFKIMRLTHSSIPTPGYESTTSTANYLISHIGATRQQVDEQDEIGTMYSRCDTGLFNLRGYHGETAEDHMKHLYAMHMMMSQTFKILDDSITSTSESHVVPDNYRLEQNWPNPFNPSTEISYSLAQKNYITLRLFNPLGQLIKTLYEGNQSPGIYTIEFYAEGMASGPYYYVLQSEDVRISRKCLYIK